MKTEKEIKDRLDDYKNKMEERSKDFEKLITSMELSEYWDDISFYKKRIQILEWVLN